MKRFQKDLTIEINQIYHNVCKKNKLFLNFLDANEFYGFYKLDYLGKQYYSGNQIFIIKFIIDKEIQKCDRGKPLSIVFKASGVASSWLSEIFNGRTHFQNFKRSNRL